MNNGIEILQEIRDMVEKGRNQVAILALNLLIAELIKAEKGGK
jgi:hypothetical protein